MLIQMAAAGTSDMTVEIVEHPTMNASTTRRLSLPDRVNSATAKRRASPVLTTTSAMQNMIITKKNTGVMKPAMAATGVVIWRSHWQHDHQERGDRDRNRLGDPQDQGDREHADEILARRRQPLGRENRDDGDEEGERETGACGHVHGTPPRRPAAGPRPEDSPAQYSP